MGLRGYAGLAAGTIFAAGTAFAQMQPVQGLGTQASPSTGPGSFPVGPLVVIPGVDLAAGHDDNLILRPTAPTASTFTILSPYVRAEARPGPHKFDATLRIDDGRFQSSSPDNYTDYSLLGNSDMVFSGRAGLRLHAEYKRGHDPRGSTDAAATATPNEFNNYGMDGVFRYGAQGARGRIEIDAGAYRRRYTNNQFATDSINHDTSQVGGTFFWRIMPRTELLAQLGLRDINYQQTASTQDSTEKRYLFGVKWEATAKTTGTAKFGRQQKEFDSPLRQNLSSSSWDMGVRWSPLSYSVFDFVSAKQAAESTGIGDAIITKNYGVTWNHAWSSRVRTQALASFSNSAFTGPTGLGRTDDTTTFGLKAYYQFRRWLRFGAEYTHYNRDSNLDAFDYKRNLLMFTVGATL